MFLKFFHERRTNRYNVFSRTTPAEPCRASLAQVSDKSYLCLLGQQLVHDGHSHMLDRGSAALRSFRPYGGTTSSRLARILRKFGSLALPNLNSLNFPSLPPTITTPYDQTDQVPPPPPFVTIWLRVISSSYEPRTKQEFRDRLFLPHPLRSGRRRQLRYPR